MDQVHVKQFQFKRPVIFEEVTERQYVDIAAGACKTIISADPDSLKNDLPALLSMAKLAEIDPLLTSFFMVDNQKWNNS